MESIQYGICERLKNNTYYLFNLLIILNVQKDHQEESFDHSTSLEY